MAAKRQAGITLIGFLIALAVVAFFGYMAMKLVPSYLEFMGVAKAMGQVSGSDVAGKSLGEIRSELIRKLDFQYVGDATVKPQDITVIRSGDAAQLNVSYDKRVPFLYNIDFLLHFEKSVTLQGNVGD